MMQPSEQTLTWACGGEHGVRPLPRSGTSWAESDTAYSATTANRSLDRRSVIMSRCRRYILWHTDVVQTTFMCNDSPELATYRKTMPDECFQQDGVAANCKQVYDDCLAQKMKEDKPDEIEQCIKRIRLPKRSASSTGRTSFVVAWSRTRLAAPTPSGRAITTCIGRPAARRSRPKMDRNNGTTSLPAQRTASLRPLVRLSPLKM